MKGAMTMGTLKGKKLLVLLGAYEPEPSANGICAQKVVQELKARGCEVELVAFSPDGKRDTVFIEEAPVHRIGGPLFYRLAQAGRHRTLPKWLLSLGRALDRAKLLFFSPFWPANSPVCFWQFYWTAKKLHRQKHFDMLLCVNAPFAAVHAGCRMKKKAPDLLLFYYFLDPISASPGPKVFSKEWTVRHGLYWEKRLFGAADRIFMLKAHRDHYRTYWGGSPHFSRFYFVDIPTVQRFPAVQRDPASPLAIDILYLGSLKKGLREPEYALRLLSQSRYAGRMRVQFIGCEYPVPPEVYGSLQLQFLPPVSHEMAVQMMCKAGLLLNLSNRVSSMIPSKVFEYISTGNPILNFYSLENEVTLPYLEHYGLSLQLKEDERLWRENLVKLDEFIKLSLGERISFERVAALFGDNTPAPLADEIERLAGREN